MAKAGQLFEEAVRHDPGYAAAWAGMAEAAVGAAFQLSVPPAEASGKARAVIARALTLDDCLAEAHEALAKCRFWFAWQWDDAEREFQRAIELNPANADTYASYGSCLAYNGRTDEALVQVARAREIDPLSIHAYAAAGYAYLIGRQYKNAITALRHALDLQPDMMSALFHLSLTYQACDQPEEALATLRQVAGAAARLPIYLAHLGQALALAGQEGEARRAGTELKDLSEHVYVSPFSFTRIHLGLGEDEQALDYLTAAYEERSPGLVYLLRPDWDPLREHPRFRDLCRRVGLPDLPLSEDPTIDHAAMNRH